MAWVDSTKCVGYIKKIPITGVNGAYTPQTTNASVEDPAELVSPMTPSTSKMMKGLGLSKNTFF
ncbi:hypothetical protein M7I_2259 [Glarea lozoyensis 74030]|uniref:Uncharacterized protein n=1 Tax=Glarea lozoyensis (strain ATCC 74030 / MF5533) TaxID=1104152 RepID=H0EIA5_GLAL7|nr:hypothetical protein M7I_2259 [Glarea lozoyensis 74030]